MTREKIISMNRKRMWEPLKFKAKYQKSLVYFIKKNIYFIIFSVVAYVRKKRSSWILLCKQKKFNIYWTVVHKKNGEGV